MTSSPAPSAQPFTVHFGELTQAQFMAHYWGKKPVLLRQAFPGFNAFVDRAALLEMAGISHAESRLIRATAKGWSMENGPFSPAHFAKPWARRAAEPWTLLVQDVNHFHPKAAQLLQAFNFVAHARLDDLMVSYAVEGGGVGAHVDSYDVFLLQASGQRRWRISEQADVSLVPDLPLKILNDFRPEQTFVLDPGDMLYLPPGVAHEGVATGTGDCLTYSIGFRAPTREEIQSALFDILIDQNNHKIKVAYKDYQTLATLTPGAIPADLAAHITHEIQAMRWDNALIDRVIGELLTAPKSNANFDVPEQPLSLERFVQAAGARGLALAPAARMSYLGDRLFLNSFEITANELGDVPGTLAALKGLADRRALPPSAELPPAVLHAVAIALYEAYDSGEVTLLPARKATAKAKG